MQVIGLNNTYTNISSGTGTGGGLTEAEIRTIARSEADAVALGELDVSTNPFVRLDELVKRNYTITENFIYDANDRVSSIEFTRADGGKYIKTLTYNANGVLTALTYTDSTGTIVGITPNYSQLKKTLNYDANGKFTSFTYSEVTV